MRKSFNTLGAVVEQGMKGELSSGDLFLFVSRDQRRAKVLYFDGSAQFERSDGLSAARRRCRDGRRATAPASSRVALTTCASRRGRASRVTCRLVRQVVRRGRTFHWCPSFSTRRPPKPRGCHGRAWLNGGSYCGWAPARPDGSRPQGRVRESEADSRAETVPARAGRPWLVPHVSQRTLDPSCRGPRSVEHVGAAPARDSTSHLVLGTRS